MNPQRDSTTIIHVNSINRVLDHIEWNLDADLSLSKLAQIACLSRFHFHRIFTLLCEETPLEYVTRKRLEKIAGILKRQKEVLIRDLAMRYGFDNLNSFSRSFKKFYGISATQMQRSSKGVFDNLFVKKSKIGIQTLSVEKYIYNVQKIKIWMHDRAKITVKNLSEQKLAYIRNRGSFDHAIEAFANLKQKMETQEWKPVKGPKWLMVVHDNPAITTESNMIQSACVRINREVDLAEGINTMIIPNGKYVVGTFYLYDHEFKNAWDSVSIWTWEKDYTSRYGYYFELFHSDSLFHRDQLHQVDICIPIAERQNIRRNN